MNSYRLEYAERILEIRQRRQLMEAIHGKQIEIWQVATKAVRKVGNGRNVAEGEEQNANTGADANANTLQIGDIVTVCETGTNVINHSHVAGNTIRTTAMQIEPAPTYESVVDEALRNEYDDQSPESNFDRESDDDYEPNAEQISNASSEIY